MTAGGGCFSVGAARIEITPPLEVPYLSFAPRHQGFAAVHDPLFARALVVSDGKKRGAIVTAEAIGFINSVLGQGRNFTAEVRAEVERRTGIPGEGVMLTAAHVHSSPDSIDIRPLRGSPEAVAWLEGLIGKIGSAAEAALNNTFNAALRIGQAEFPGYSKNRRGEECVDDRLTALLFESPDKTRRILLVNYACHPVIVQAQDRVSADYVGVMAAALEKETPGLEACLFLQGAAGDINPWIDDTRDFADVERMGAALAGKVVEIIDGISAVKESAEPSVTHQAAEPLLFKCASQLLDLPSRPLPAPEETAAQAAGDNRMWLGDELAERLLDSRRSYPAELQALRLGNAVLAGIPGEPFCRMGKAIRDLAAPLTGIPVGYANGYVGYIVPPESWARGGYEVDPGPWSKVAPESHAIILDALSGLFKKIGA
jgi:neutral ceramidase